jgi:hypothetical protein
MSPRPALGAESRILQRRRERGAICTQATQDTTTETRVGGVPAGGRLTLEQMLEGVWEGLCAGGTAACPVCHGEMGPGAAGTAAHCQDCGASLS